ncbi:beta-1,4-galactosyltransferase 4 [Plutella xylostella]|uniref:beta-1,4-galactosyltransferase 4 n=1 Tax=Plutella xylostella TaxID=51655 RepID=UPI00203292FD|nr:beta-1,4-galactosyltransferase 4 [Plutella xylostella]
MYKRRNVWKNFLCYGLVFSCFVFVINLFFTSRPASPPSYVELKREDMLQNLVEVTSKNLTSYAYEECEYRSVVLESAVLSPSAEAGWSLGRGVRDGGVYAPSECRPKYSVAVIVPYRESVSRLYKFLMFMHSFLHHQQLHYRLYIVEQMDTEPLNRARLLNIGAAAAIEHGFPCLILHDLNLLPVRPANLYACTKLPRLMTHYVKYRLPYTVISTNSIIAITSKQFKTINGLSNKNDDWIEGLDARLEAHELKMCQFEPEVSKYYNIEYDESDWVTSLNQERQSTTKQYTDDDGISTNKYTKVSTVLHPQFTHIMVDLAVRSYINLNYA